jgi:GT2 family glycosyltransferase
MDARAPAVVAVLVTRDPGPWFETVLRAWARQDYEELSVLVLVSGGTTDPTPLVARHLPSAFVRRLPEDHGFGAAANHAAAMVEGAAFFLLCHDDCAPDPDAVHTMVEESFRSNAGVVTPKMVRWDDPSVLLHVGMGADKTGAVVERVVAGEVDHGQHDAVRDVFVAPGGCTLIRADLFGELGGYDTGMVAMGEDLDLSWRAQVAGARVVVAPDARVRHLEVLAGGRRAVAPQPDGSPSPSLQVLQRRHELRTVLKCYGGFHRLRVLPQVLVLAAAEVAAALVARDRARARAVLAAFRWNLRHRGELRTLRKELRRHRVLPDAEVRRLQLRGSTRLATYLSRLAHQGFEVAHGLVPAREEGLEAGAAAQGEPLLTGSVGAAFSEDADFDDLDDLGRRAGRDRHGRRRPRQLLATGRSRLVLGVVAGLVLVVGSRRLLSGRLPLVGQFAVPLDWGATWSHLFSAWQPAGVGSGAPASPAFGVLGLIGTVLLGGMGLTQKVAVLGCIPVGAWGLARLLRPFGSPRARVVGAVAYLGLALPYDALAQGRWDGLVAYAATPWVLLRLARASSLPPYDAAPRLTGWRSTAWGETVVLGAIEALCLGFAPAMSVVVLLCGAGLVVGSLLVGGARPACRAAVVALGATVLAVVLCLPWTLADLAAGRSALSLFGLPAAASSAPSFTSLLRFDVGPAGSSVLTWLLLASGLLSLVLARQARLAWAGRLFAVALGAWVLALAAARGDMGSFAPSVDVLLAPAAAAVAAGVGLSVAAFESDLVGYRFGWRQPLALLAMAAAAIGLVPVLAAAGGGRWGLPSTGYDQALAFTAAGADQGGFRVLWLGDPRVLPLGGWSVGPGLAYATSEGGPPNAAELFAPADPGPAAGIAGDLQLATEGRTSHLGQLLAADSIRYVVVLDSLAPEQGGTGGGATYPPPPGVLPALAAQGDLLVVPSSGQGFSVFENTVYRPERAAVTVGAAGWRPVLAGPPGVTAYRGPLGRGTVLVSSAPASRWRLAVDGRPATTSVGPGGAVRFDVPTAGTGSLTFAGSPWVPLGVAVELALWAVVALGLLGRRRWLDWWWRPLAAGWALARPGRLRPGLAWRGGRRSPSVHAGSGDPGDLPAGRSAGSGSPSSPEDLGDTENDPVAAG